MDTQKIEQTVNQITPEKAADTTTKALTLITRFTQPTPTFWAKVRNISLILTGIGGAVALASGVITIPEIVVTGAKLLGVVGATLATGSQMTVKGE